VKTVRSGSVLAFRASTVDQSEVKIATKAIVVVRAIASETADIAGLTVES
jgi:hypothetical protein